jgi:SulP family sulfate permease
MNHVAPVEELEPKEVWEDIRVDEERIRIIDVREPREFRGGHIPGADLVPLSRILNGEFRLAENEDRSVILVCRSGRRSKRAARIITNDNGQVKIVKGGMLAWESAGLLEAVE